MKKNPLLTLSFIALLSCFGLSACERSTGVEAAREPDRQNVLTADDKDFADYAAEMHTGEIEMAKQAKQKSSNDDVRDYADKVIDVHSKALDHLSHDFGKQSNEASLDTKSHMKFLGTLSGSQFDQEFIALMVADHQSATDTFRDELNNTRNADMKDYLQDTLQGLQQGLRDGQELQGSKTTGEPTN